MGGRRCIGVLRPLSLLDGRARGAARLLRCAAMRHWGGFVLAICVGNAACGDDGAARDGASTGTTTTATPTASTDPSTASTSSTAATTVSSSGSTTGTASTTGSGTETGSDGSSESTGSTGEDVDPPPPPLTDVSLGPYPSLLTIALDSVASNAASLDTSTTYSQSAAQGYVLQAIGELLWASRGEDLPWQADLIQTALGEIAELQAADDLVVGGGPGFGLEDPWDAFGDGTTNPAFTAYTWQSGSVAYGVAKVARAMAALEHDDADEVLAYAQALVDRWDSHYTDLADGGYWWYSTQPADAIAVHNTSALIAMASQIVSEIADDPSYGMRPPACADLLWARMSGNPSIGYVWNYADDGYPVAPRPEDISHALITLQFMREARDRDWWTNSQMQGVAVTLLSNIWSDNPSRLHGFVDGSDPSDGSEWTWTRAAVVGYAAHGDAPGGDPEVFEAARSILFSSYLSRYERPLSGATVDSVRLLAIAIILARRPASFANGTELEMAAGPGDQTPGGVRFYTVDWADPADHVAGLTLPARIATAANANVLVDLDDTDDGRVVVSVTYSATASGTIEQWDGTAYHILAALPGTQQDDGVARWVRTTFELDPSIYFDYQAGVPGRNVLLQLSTNGVAVHRLEATRLAAR